MPIYPRGNGFKIVKDCIRETLGFPTTYESLDKKIKNIDIQTENNLNLIIAKRNILISKLESILNHYNSYLKIYEKFFKHFEIIKKEAEQDILKRNSYINISLYKKDGTLFAVSNYTLLKELIINHKNPEEVVYLTKQLEEKYEKNLAYYVNLNIYGNGIVQIGNKNIKNIEIHTNYLLIMQLLNNNLLRDLNNNIISININSFEDIQSLEQKVKESYYELKLTIDKHVIQLNNLKKLQVTDKNALEQIDLTRKLLQTSPEYVAAKASHDYLEEINKLKR